MKASVTQTRHGPASSASVRRLQKHDRATEEMTQEGIIDSLTAAKTIFAKYHPDSAGENLPQHTHSFVQKKPQRIQSQTPLRKTNVQRSAPKTSNNSNSPYIIKNPSETAGLKKKSTLVRPSGLRVPQHAKPPAKKPVNMEPPRSNRSPIAPKQIKTRNGLKAPQKTGPGKKSAKEQFLASPTIKSLPQAKPPSTLPQSPASKLVSRHSSGHNSIRSVRTVSTNGTLTKTPVFASPNASPSIHSNNSSTTTVKSPSVKPSHKKSKPLSSISPSGKVQEKKTAVHTQPSDKPIGHGKKHGNNLFSSFSSSSDTFTSSSVSSSQRLSDSDSNFSQIKKQGSASAKSKVGEKKHNTLTRKPNTKTTVDAANKMHHSTAQRNIKSDLEDAQSNTCGVSPQEVGAALAASKALYTLPGYDSMNASVEPSKKDKVHHHHHGLRSKLFSFRRDPKMRNSLDNSNFNDTFSINSATQPKSLNGDQTGRSKRHSLDLYRSGSMVSQRPNDSTLSFTKSNSSFGNFPQNRELKVQQLQKKIEKEKKPEPKTINMRTVAKINLLADEIAKKTIDSFKNGSHEGLGKTNLSLKMPSATSSPKRLTSTSPSANDDTMVLSPLSIPDTPLAGFASRNGSKSSLLQHFRPNASQPSQAEAHLLNNFISNSNSFSQASNNSGFYGTKNLKRIPPPPSSIASSQSLASSLNNFSPSAPGSVRSSFDMSNFSSESLANLEPALTIKKNTSADDTRNLIGSADQISYNEDSGSNSVVHSQFDSPNHYAENSDAISFAKSDKSNSTLENLPKEKSLEFAESEKDREEKPGSAIFGRAMRSLTNFSLHSDSKDEKARDNGHGTRNRTSTAVSNAATIVAPQHPESANSSPPSPQTVQPPESSASSIASCEKKKSFGPFASLIKRVSSGHHDIVDNHESSSKEEELHQTAPSQQPNCHYYQYEKLVPQYQQVPQTKILTTLREDKPKRSKREKLKQAFMLSGHSGAQKHAKNSEHDGKTKRRSSRDQAMSHNNGARETERRSSANGSGSDDGDDDDDDDEYDYLYYKTNQSMPHKLYRYKDDDDEDEVYKKKKVHLKSLIKTPAKFTYDSIKKSTNKLNDMTAMNHNHPHIKSPSTDNLHRVEEVEENGSPLHSDTFDQNEQTSEIISESPEVSASGDASDNNFNDTYSTLAGDMDDSNVSSRVSLDGTPVKNNFNESFVMPVGTSHPDMEMYMVRGRGGNKKIKDKVFNADKPWKNHVDLGYITPQEKKRYEGIWVSNRNSYLSLLPPSLKSQYENEVIEEGDEDVILNVLVYEIWSRSHLSPKLLRQIYNMVDLYKDGLLRRRSFIVGMWLIDQCLYGKKLPPKVDDRVWQSVDKIIIGVNIDPKSFAKKKKKYIRKQLKDLKKQEKQHNQKLMLARQGK